MTREAMKYGAASPVRGFPDFAAPAAIKRVAMQAIADDINQYAITWGAKDFRQAIAAKTKWHLGLEIDPETEITVTCGSTEGMIVAMMATVDPGEEVVIFEPFYENYAPDAILSDAHPRYVPLRAPDWSFDRDELRAAFNEKTRAIIVCNPNNPTGKVFTREEMEFIASLCQEFDALCFTDEIYEHILYPIAGKRCSISMAHHRAWERTVTWNRCPRLIPDVLARRYCIASPDITSGIRKVTTFDGGAGRAAAGAVYALSLPNLLRSAAGGLSRAATCCRWNLARWLVFVPDCAYYIMTTSALGFSNDGSLASFDPASGRGLCSRIELIYGTGASRPILLLQKDDTLCWRVSGWRSCRLGSELWPRSSRCSNAAIGTAMALLLIVRVRLCLYRETYRCLGHACS